MSGDEIIIGIDLGTTFSLVAYCDEGGPHVIRDEHGDGRVPSVIGVSTGVGGGPSRITIGCEARNHAVENPRATVYSIKRLIGKGMSDIRKELPFLTYHVVPGQRETVQVEIDGRRYSPEEISALILRELKDRAERHIGRTVRKAIITVPAYFDDAQRQATRDAGAAAGLDVARIINEPTAAALAYGIGVRELVGEDSSNQSAAPQQAAGPASASRSAVPLPLPKCSDERGDVQTSADATRPEQLVAVYDLGGGTFDVSILRIEEGVFQVLATAGDTHLGGDDFDRAIITLVSSEVQDQFGLTIEAPASRQALRLLAEQIKIRLSDADQAEIELALGGGRTYRRVLTRAEFEAATEPLVDRTLAMLTSALRDAKLSASDLDQLVLVGGSTRMPMIRERVAALIGRPPYTALNPDEVVAIGAAIQASVLAGAQPDMLLLDVTPLSLGIETMGGAMGKLILRNTTIPCRVTELFTTFVDGQTAIKLTVLQGERELATDCRVLAEFELREIPPMPAGIPKVEVEFLIDANGILNVSARELRSGRRAGIQVVPNYGLTRDEVERMMRESVAFAKADLNAHRRIDLVNQVEFDTAKTERVLKKVGSLLDAQERKRIERDLAALRALARSTSDLDALHRELDAFGRSTIHLAELGMREALVDSTVRS